MQVARSMVAALQCVRPVFPQKWNQFNCITLLKGSAKDSILYYYIAGCLLDTICCCIAHVRRQGRCNLLSVATKLQRLARTLCVYTVFRLINEATQLDNICFLSVHFGLVLNFECIIIIKTTHTTHITYTCRVEVNTSKYTSLNISFFFVNLYYIMIFTVYQFIPP